VRVGHTVTSEISPSELQAQWEVYVRVDGVTEVRLALLDPHTPCWHMTTSRKRPLPPSPKPRSCVVPHCHTATPAPLFPWVDNADCEPCRTQAMEAGYNMQHPIIGVRFTYTPDGGEAEVVHLVRDEPLIVEGRSRGTVTVFVRALYHSALNRCALVDHSW
jgi:hypothetical protein